MLLLTTGLSAGVSPENISPSFSQCADSTILTCSYVSGLMLRIIDFNVDFLGINPSISCVNVM